jgi:hypothetical protein
LTASKEVIAKLLPYSLSAIIIISVISLKFRSPGKLENGMSTEKGLPLDPK